MGKIVASCGHELKDDENTVSVILAGEDCDLDGFHKCVTYAEYCPECAERAKGGSDWLQNSEEAEAYLSIEEHHD